MNIFIARIKMCQKDNMIDWVIDRSIDYWLIDLLTDNKQID